jgi:hypothetical protein
MKTNKSVTNLSDSLTITSFTVSTDTTVPVIAEVTAVATPTNDKTPDYTFSSNEAGTITYGGSCSSSTTSATSGDNTITFSTLDNGTYSNCTIKVTDSAGNESNTLEITDFTVTYWQLIARQVGTSNLFSVNARTTFKQNENDPSSSTFMSIGNLIPSNYVTDGKYKFKLVWDGVTNFGPDNSTAIWTQTSWLENTTIADFDDLGDSGVASAFQGLGLSQADAYCVLDGNGSGGGFYSCVGAIALWHLGIVGPTSTQIANSMHLYIWAP